MDPMVLMILAKSFAVIAASTKTIGTSHALIGRRTFAAIGKIIDVIASAKKRITIFFRTNGR